MKTGYYIRFVPALNEYYFYVWNGKSLFVLAEAAFHVLKDNGMMQWMVFNNFIEWYKSAQGKPTKKLGFEYVCNLKGE